MSGGIAFSPLQVGPMKVMNRFMRSPTYEGLSDDASGMPSRRLFTLIEKLAKGRVGLIIPGYVYPSKAAKAVPRQTGFYNRELASAWIPTIKKCQAEGSKLMFQIAHAGAAAVDGQGFGPSKGQFATHEMTIAEIEDVIDSFAKAATEAFIAGADGVELHAGHGYLLSLFMSPVSNTRKDKYGGSDEGRLRIVTEIAEQIRKATSPGFAIGIKMNGADGRRGGVEKELSAKYVNMLRGKIDLFEITCGLGVPNATGRKILRNPTFWQSIKEKFNPWKFHEFFNADMATYIKKMNPWAIVATIGGARSLNGAEKLLKDGAVDLVSLSRPLIREPNLIKMWEEGKKKTCDCISCSECLTKAFTTGLVCTYPK